MSTASKIKPTTGDRDRPHRAAVRLSRDERAHLERRARQSNVSASDVIRHFIRADMATTMRKPPSRARNVKRVRI